MAKKAKAETMTALAMFDTGKWAIRSMANPQEVGQMMLENVGSAVGEFDFDRIGMPGGGAVQWEIPSEDGGVEHVSEIVGVIVGQGDRRVFWEKSIGEGDKGPPDCSSQDGIKGYGTVADEYGGDCARCPMAQFGSKANGRGQACSARKLIFILPEDKVLPTVVSLAPTSLKAMRQYLLRLASKLHPFYGVVTALGLETDKNSEGVKYSKVAPRVLGFLDQEMCEMFRQYKESIAPIVKHVTVTADEIEEDDVV